MAAGISSIFSLKDKKIWQKLLLISIPFLVPLVVIAIALGWSVREMLDTIRLEQRGLEYLQAVENFRQGVQDHRDLVARQRGGEEGLDDAVAAARGSIEKAVEAVDAVDGKYGQTFHTSEGWAAIRKDWRALKSDVFDLNAKAVLARHNQLLAGVQGVVNNVHDYSTLTLDPVAESYYLQDALVLRLPAAADQLTQARSLAVLAAAGKSLSEADRLNLAVLLAQAKAGREAVQGGLARFLQHQESYKAEFQPLLRNYLEAGDAFAALVEDQLLKPGQPGVSPSDVADGATTALNASNKLVGAVEPALEQELNGRYQLYQRRLLLAGLATGACLLVAVLLAYLTTRSITRQVGSLMRMFNQIGMGNFEARASVVGNDELGEVATSLNAMLDNTMHLIQSQDERDNIQRSISQLLEEVSGVAEGDLTKEAAVTADMTGAIADAFNYMIEQLRKVIGNVQKATLQVSRSATQIHETAEHLAHGSEAQAEQIVNTSAAIDEMAGSIQQVSENATVSANVAQKALANCRQGNVAVQNTVQGMNRIRDQVQETAKRIKRLGESSQEIGQIVQLIDDIADRTSILALNASIQAAMAGEAGRGFAVVAEEVERLAERSTDATKKIATLIKTIQVETHEAVSAMEKGIHEVVEGSKLANQAGHALGEIESVSNQLAELIQSISLASRQQARGSEALAKSMNEISSITQTTASGTKQAAVSVNHLAALADELRASVSAFRLPTAYAGGADVEYGQEVEHNGNGNGSGHGSRPNLRPGSSPGIVMRR
jgi:twitching motility protein PilJ